VRGEGRLPSSDTASRLALLHPILIARLCHTINDVHICGMRGILPITSTLTTFNLSSDTSLSPFSTFSRVWSRSFLAVATTGTLVVCSRRRANSIPMPRDAGATSAHGCMATAAKMGVRLKALHRCTYASRTIRPWLTSTLLPPRRTHRTDLLQDSTRRSGTRLSFGADLSLLHPCRFRRQTPRHVFHHVPECLSSA